MQLNAFLCEAATVADGRLYAHGAGWRTFETPHLPAVVPQLSVGLVVHPSSEEAAAGIVASIRLFDPDGRPSQLVSASVEGVGEGMRTDELEVSLQVEPEPDSVFVLAITMTNLVLPNEGGYHLEVSVDGEQTALPLRVMVSPALGD